MKKFIIFFFVSTNILACSFSSSKIKFYDVHISEGRLYYVRLYDDYPITVGKNIIFFKKDSILSFSEFSGKINSGYLKHDHNLLINNQLITAKAVGFLSGGIGNYDIAFHDNGNIYRMWLAEDTKISVGNKQYKFSKAKTLISMSLDTPDSKDVKQIKEYLQFYKNGHLYSGYLGQPIKYSNKIIKTGTEVVFNGKGELIKYWDAQEDDYILIKN